MCICSHFSSNSVVFASAFVLVPACLKKACCSFCLLVLWQPVKQALCRPVWWRNQWWMEETETGWYVPRSRDGEWVFDDHMGWLSLDDWEDEFLPTPKPAIPQPAVLQANKRHTPSMPTIPEEPGRSSSSASGLPGGGSGASGLPAEGRNANNMEQCLQMLGSYLERKKRFDNRGYRSQIRRQLRRLLDDNDIHYPDWLDDHTQPVNEWKDRTFKEIQSIKKNWQTDHSNRS